MRTSITFVLSSLVSLLGLASVPVWAQPGAPRFEVAGYRLGMTNAQASKIGLSDCTTMNIRAVPKGDSLITCTGKSPELPEMRHPLLKDPAVFEGPFLSFDSRSKLLVRIEFVAFNWANPDPRTPKLLKLLNVQPCGEQWRFTGWHEDWTCAVQPDRVLSVKQTMGKTHLRERYPSYLDVVAEVSKGRVAWLYKTRAREESAEREATRKERAARELEAGR